MAKRPERAKVDQDYALYRLVDLNVPRDAIRAGYSAKAAYIADLMDGRVKKTKIDAGYVLMHMRGICDMAVHDI